MQQFYAACDTEDAVCGGEGVCVRVLMHELQDRGCATSAATCVSVCGCTGVTFVACYSQGPGVNKWQMASRLHSLGDTAHKTLSGQESRRVEQGEEGKKFNLRLAKHGKCRLPRSVTGTGWHPGGSASRTKPGRCHPSPHMRSSEDPWQTPRSSRQRCPQRCRSRSHTATASHSLSTCSTITIPTCVCGGGGVQGGSGETASLKTPVRERTTSCSLSHGRGPCGTPRRCCHWQCPRPVHTYVVMVLQAW
jgi:hypothetical protein